MSTTSTYPMPAMRICWKLSMPCLTATLLKSQESSNALSHQSPSSSRNELGILNMVTQVLTLAHAKLMDSGTTIPGYQRRRVDALINRHGQAGIEKLLIECAQFNSMFLGMARGDAADLLRNLLFAIAGVQRSDLETQYEWRVIDRHD